MGGLLRPALQGGDGLPEFSLPDLPQGWVLFAGWIDIFAGLIPLLILIPLALWWRQQSRFWTTVMVAALAVAIGFSIASLNIFEVPPHFVGCPGGCPGWQGYPLPFASLDFDGVRTLAPVDFVLNVLWTWLLWLTLFMLLRIMFLALDWQSRSLRFRLLLFFFVLILPFALLPRLLEPPQPTLQGENQRLAINAQRTAQYTYSITGPWVQRLSVEDIRELPATTAAAFGFEPDTTQVCLRGYTYFYIPWRRYRIILDASGVVALNLAELPLEQPCW